MGSIVNAIVVGKIVKPHGIKGHVVVEILSDSPTRFAPGSVLQMGNATSGGREVAVRASSPHQGRMIVLFEGVADRNEAELLRGESLFIAPDALIDLDPDTFWEHELDGMEVVDPDGQVLGVMSEVLRRDEQDLWVVRSGDDEVLVPAVKQIILSVDRDKRRIVVDAPEGLF